jgi:uncharacterized protein YqgV (UPF0045/DUF77 family)
MLVEFSIISFSPDEHLNQLIAEALKLLDDSGLPYELTDSMTCIEGEWEEIMPLIRQCHEIVRSMSPHVVTMIRIEDEAMVHQEIPKEFVIPQLNWAYA